LSSNKLVKKLQSTIEAQAKTMAILEAKIVVLEAEIVLLKNKKNSNNSSIPPSQDQNRPKPNQSLRQPTDRKPGGQPGHEGVTLLCSDHVDEVIKHSPDFCSCCGIDLSNHQEIFVSSRQMMDIPPIVLKCIEHQLYKKQCSCGHTMQGSYPQHMTATVQYGPNIEALVGYLHARQYLPYARLQELMKDVMGVALSVGGINNILNRLAKKAMPMYEAIKERIELATCIGTDETGVNINGKNHWAWTWQNKQLTYIVCAPSRGYQTIKEAFSNGLPKAVLVHDRWPSHFMMDAKGHQICTAHLLRDLNYINELYKNKCHWATSFKALLQEAIELKKQYTDTDYYYPDIKRQALFDQLKTLLAYPILEEHKKSKTLQKKLLAKHQCVLYFLELPNVPPDNNGSERAIRNIKVKQKISGQFKSLESANVFATLRSIIDTTNKAGQNILHALKLIATLRTE
jgi:transposase